MRTAVVLFTMGGPDCLEAVEPFLFNLFNDPAIIGLPGLFRQWIARRIARRRAPITQQIYRHIGGRSPLLEETRRQAESLEKELGSSYKTFISMRYWHPFTEETVQAVATWGAQRLVLLPLYPQFSTTTSQSSLKKWQEEADKIGLCLPTETIQSYPDNNGFIAALVDLIKPKIEYAPSSRLLFSAHGLPERIVAKGDPYPSQVQSSVTAVVEALGRENLDWALCYQSRVGPLKWIGPSIEDELKRAGQDQVPVIVCPIAFVSEHSETLVELDIEYRLRSEQLGIPNYQRIPAVGAHPAFISGLASLVRGQ